jgi:outer membrane protease
MPPKQNQVKADPATEAANRIKEVKDKLEKNMVDKTKFEEAKSEWTKLENHVDHRINKLNDFSVSAIKSLKQAEEEFTKINQSLQEL